MYELQLSTVPQWSHQGNSWCPISVDTPCPHCSKLVNFRLGSHQNDPPRKTISASGTCPSCGNVAWFWIVEPGSANDSSQRGCSGLFMFPKARPRRSPALPNGQVEVEALERAYHTAIDAYNAGLWGACATSCRRTLEGIVATRYPEAKPPLFIQLKEVFGSQELLDPLIHLSDTLRKGGNLGAHFDLEKEPDQDVATLMLDLLDFVMDYLYSLKARSAQLEQRLDSLGSEA